MVRNLLRRLWNRTNRSNDELNPEWPYRWTEERIEAVEGQEVIAYGTDERGDSQVFAGPRSRELIEQPRDYPGAPVTIGVGTRRGRIACIDQEFFKQHSIVFGTTGRGKSNLIEIVVEQLAYDGNQPGICVLDGKGDLGDRLLEILPAEALDRVVWIEPGSDADRLTGFNILDVGVEPDHPQFDKLVENMREDLVAALAGDEYWGPLMGGVAETLIRITAHSSYTFTVVDLYYALVSEESCRRLAAIATAEGMDVNFLDYIDVIAEMDNEQFDALMRRFKNWVEDTRARPLIALRDSTITIEEIIEEGLIAIVRMGGVGEDLKQMLGSLILRRYWSSIRTRADMAAYEREDVYLVADEFHVLAGGDAKITTMLAQARAQPLAVFMYAVAEAVAGDRDSR